MSNASILLSIAKGITAYAKGVVFIAKVILAYAKGIVSIASIVDL